MFDVSHSVSMPAPLEIEITVEFPSAGGGAYPEYAGDYSITPTTAAQTIPTANRVLTRNLNIEPIPYAEVTNAASGVTATIG